MNRLKRTTALLVVMLVLGTAGCASTGGSFFSDAAITNRVKNAIYSEPTLKTANISVSTDQNVVHLSGTVKSRAERAKAIAVAREIEGVKAVKTDLVVKP
jgi:osmotically-inducible protein OsmY